MSDPGRRRFLATLAATPWLLSCAGAPARRREPEPMPVSATASARVEIREPPQVPVPDSFPAPDLRDSQILERVAGIRPYRRGALRLEAEDRAGHLVLHNYGHGGAGITTAWGCAEEVLRLTRAAGVAPGAGAVVVGAGIAGLTAALVLREAGHPVRLVYRETTPQVVSDLAGGQWAPSLIAWGSGSAAEERRDRVLRASLTRYRAELGRGAGVSERPNFVALAYRSAVARVAGRYLPEAVPHDPLPIAGLGIAGSSVSTLLVEPTRYLRSLWRRLRESGVDEQIEELRDAADFVKLGGAFTVHASGLGARQLCQDSAMLPIRGQLLLLRPQPLGYLLSHPGGYLFAREDRLVLGGSVERGVDDPTPTPAVCAGILARHRAFFGG